uniref:Cytochrome b n=1 Tax=Brugia timori TaxID=42155 RepID=A0A0R3QIW1_9BILA
LGIMLISQIITGFFLTFYYTAGDAFSSVNLGWLIRIMHSNGASIFFLFIYLHIFKGLINSSYRLSSIAFTGYVLIWGQIRYWAAVVITSLITSVPYLGNLYFSFNLSDPMIFVESDSIARPAHVMMDNILIFLSICFV